MFGFVWIVFLLVQESSCFQPEGLTSSAELSISGQNSTVPYGKVTFSSIDTTPLATETESSVETGLVCNNAGNCTSQRGGSSSEVTLNPTDSSGVTSLESRTVSWKPADRSTTPDIYATLHHNENELDFDAKDKEQQQFVDNSTTKTTENLRDTMTTRSAEEFAIFVKIPSGNSEEQNHSSTNLNDGSAFRISSPEDSQLLSFSPESVAHTTSLSTDAVSQSFGTEMKPASPSAHLLLRSTRSTVSDDIRQNTTDHMMASDTETTVSPTEQLVTSKPSSSSAHPLFRSTRNIVLSDTRQNTTDHTIVLDRERTVSSAEELVTTLKPQGSSAYPLFRSTRNAVSPEVIQNTTDHTVALDEDPTIRAAKQLDTTTTDPKFVISNPNDSFETLELKNSSLQPGILSSTNAENLTPKNIDDQVLDMETSSAAKLTTTPVPEDTSEMQSTIHPSQSTDDISPLAISVGFKMNTSPNAESISLGSHQPIKEIQNSTDIVTVPYPISDKEVLGETPTDHGLFDFNKVSVMQATSEVKSTTTYPNAFDEKKSLSSTTEIPGPLNSSVDHITLDFVSPIIQEGTVPSVLTTTRTELDVASVLETTNTQSSQDIQPTTLSWLSQTPSSTVIPPTLSSLDDQSITVDKVSTSTSDKPSIAIDKISPRTVHQTLSDTVDPSTSVVETSTSSVIQASPTTGSSTVDQSTSSFMVGYQTLPSKVDQPKSSTVDQTLSPFMVDHPTSPSVVDQPMPSSTTSQQLSRTDDQSTMSGTIDHKSSSTFQQSTISSSSDPETTISMYSSTTTEPKPTVSPQVKNSDMTTTPESVSIPTTIPKTSAGIHVFPSMLSTTVPYEMTTESEILDVSQSTSSFDHTYAPTSNAARETYREGKHIPFSTESTKRQTVDSSNDVIFVTSGKESETETTTINLEEMIYHQLYYQDLAYIDRSNVITILVHLPSSDSDNVDMNLKIAEVHNWLTHILMTEFQNWTRDPFDKNGSQPSDMPFGKVSILYILPTPKTKSSNITMTFIAHNQWRNETLPVDFLISVLNYHSPNLKQLINASSVHFYHGLLKEDSDLLPEILEKYGVIVFTSALAVIGTALLICIVIVYRKRNRRSVHYLSNNKLPHNLQESVGIDLTPAVVILQDEKKILNGNGKICDDEGWLVPIHEVPVAEDTTMPKVQDTKL